MTRARLYGVEVETGLALIERDEEPHPLNLTLPQLELVETWAKGALEAGELNALGVLSACLLWRSTR